MIRTDRRRGGLSRVRGHHPPYCGALEHVSIAWLSDLLAISALVFVWLVCRRDATALPTPDVWSEYARGPSASLQRRSYVRTCESAGREASRAARKAPQALEQCENGLKGSGGGVWTFGPGTM